MSPGDLVQLRADSKAYGLSAGDTPNTPGIVIDIIEDDVGYHHALVLFAEGRWWIYCSQLEVVSDT